MSSHRLRVLTVLLASFLSVTVAQAQDDTERTVVTFANWKIVYIPKNGTYNLVGQAGSGASFTVQCHPENVLSVLIPYREKTSGVITVTVWSDAMQPRDIAIPHFEGVIATALSSAPATKQQTAVFLDALSSARSFFAYSIGRTTAEYDARHLAAARARFRELCTAPGSRPLN